MSGIESLWQPFCNGGSEELPFNQQVCGVEAKHTMYTCETPREYCRTSVVPTQSAGIRTGVNELMSRAVRRGPP